MIKIGVLGACGRMGNKILKLLHNDKNFDIIGAIDIKGNENIGKNVFNDTDLKFSYKLDEVIEKIDVAIDFSFHFATINNLKLFEKYKKPIVIGTTGFSEEEKKEIERISKVIPIVISPNMSIGVNVFFKIISDMSKILNDYDIEVLEIHHNKKKDSPSGTAMKIADILLKNTHKNKLVFGREGLIGERKKEEIGIHSIRMGDVVGEHTVFFCGNNERLEISHKANSRNNFANGAILASKWLIEANKKNGIFDMFDVLDLN